MIKIEKIKNGYILEIEKIIALNTDMDSQLKDGMESLSKIMPTLTNEIMKNVEGDQLLNSIMSVAKDKNSAGIVKHVSNNNKIFFPKFKELTSYLGILTESLDTKGILTDPNQTLNS